MARKVNGSGQTEIELSPLHVFKGALDLLSDESKWTKGYFAFDVNGERCAAESTDACKFCLIGAIRKVSEKQDGLAVQCLTEIYKDLGADMVAHWNDNADRKHSEVIALLNKTIARLESVT